MRCSPRSRPSPGEPVSLGRVTAESPRLQDLIDPDVPLDITVHDNFEFWVDGAGEIADDVRASLERASAYAHPTVKLASVPSAYWTQMGEKEHLRWVMPHDEETLLNALARLHAAGEDSLGEGTRFVGMFRAQGLVCPVWDLPLGTGAEAIEAPAEAFGTRLDAAMAERRAAHERGAPRSRRAHHPPGHAPLAMVAARLVRDEARALVRSRVAAGERVLVTGATGWFGTTMLALLDEHPSDAADARRVPGAVDRGRRTPLRRSAPGTPRPSSTSTRRWC